MPIQQSRPQAVVSQHQMQAMSPYRPVVMQPQGFKKPMQMTQATVSIFWTFEDRLSTIFSHHIFSFFLPVIAIRCTAIPADSSRHS